MILPDALNGVIRSGRIGPLNMIASSGNVEPVIDWQAFGFTPNDTGEWVGYTDGDLASPPFNPPMGTITNEPAPGVQLTALYFDINTMTIKMLLKGDYLKEAPALSLVIDGTVNPFKSSTTYIGNTVIEFEGITPSFNAGQAYTALIKQEG